VLKTVVLLNICVETMMHFLKTDKVRIFCNIIALLVNLMHAC